jgi:uncharacterized protein (TIGR03067 family)
MKKQFVSILTVLGFAAALATPVVAEDLDMMAGKWSVQKTNDDGQRYTQQIEIKTNKFTFQITGSDDQTRLYAQGDVKLDKTGPFKTITFSNIKAGTSATENDSIDDTFTSIYKFGEEDTLLVVMNFDKDRDQMKPSLDVYHKAKQAKK